MTPAKPGKTRKGAGRKVVFAVSKASPCSEPLGLQGKVYLGVCFPPPACGRMPTPSPQARRSGCFGGRWSRAKQEKLLLGELALQKQKSPLSPHQAASGTAKAPRAKPTRRRGGWSGREPGLCFDFNPQM